MNACLIIPVLVFCFFCGTLCAAAQTPSLDVRPNVISIGTHYNGKRLAVTGTVPEGCKAVVRMLGKRVDAKFKEKGKVFGLLWMNMATVTLHEIPGVFLLAADADVYDQGGDSWQRLGLGFFSFQGKTDDLVFGEFLKLKKKEELYKVHEGGITYGPVTNGTRTFSCGLDIPSELRQGIYQVDIFAVRDGRTVMGQASENVHAELSELPAMITSVAYGHPLLYGILATLIAILAGLLMTVVFRERSGVH
jgi:hypothetical protein